MENELIVALKSLIASIEELDKKLGEREEKLENLLYALDEAKKVLEIRRDS